MRDLEARARSLGYHQMVLAAFLSNAPVKRLSDRHGFQTVGVYHEHGLLAGRWGATSSGLSATFSYEEKARGESISRGKIACHSRDALAADSPSPRRRGARG